MVNFWLFANDMYNDTKNVVDQIRGLKGECIKIESDLNSINSRIGKVRQIQEEEKVKVKWHKYYPIKVFNMQLVTNLIMSFLSSYEMALSMDRIH